MFVEFTFILFSSCLIWLINLKSLLATHRKTCPTATNFRSCSCCRRSFWAVFSGIPAGIVCYPCRYAVMHTKVYQLYGSGSDYTFSLCFCQELHLFCRKINKFCHKRIYFCHKWNKSFHKWNKFCHTWNKCFHNQKILCQEWILYIHFEIYFVLYENIVNNNRIIIFRNTILMKHDNIIIGW